MSCAKEKASTPHPALGQIQGQSQANPTPEPSPSPEPSMTPEVTAGPTPFASGTGRPAGLQDIPYGTPVPGKPGFVISPHALQSGYVDVRGFPPGTQVKCPYTGKIFLVP